MPITQNDVLRLSEPVERMYMDCVSQLLINLASHLGANKALSTAQWETRKLSELDAVTQESIEIIAANVGVSSDTIKAVISKALGIELDALEKTLADAVKVCAIHGVQGSWRASEGVKTVLTNLLKQAREHVNIVNTVMLQSTRERYINAVEFAADLEAKEIQRLFSISDEAQLLKQLDITQKELNATTMSVAIGAQARNNAVRAAVKRLADQGITGYVDRAGHQWSPEAYINMDVRTTVHNAAIQGQKARSADYGVSTFQVSSHPGARPLCAPYQGKIYSWDNSAGTISDLHGRQYTYDGINSTSYGQAAGLFGINCGHSPQTFVPGYGIPRYEPTKDAAENERLYKLTQTQRAYERDIRHEKTLALAYNAAGDKAAFSQTMADVKKRNAKYKAFCTENGLTERTDRLQVHGYNKSMSAKARKK